MSPDSAETRLGRLERGLAKMEQRVEDMFALALANVVADLDELKQAVATVRREVQDDRDAARKRGEVMVRERKADRRWLIGTMLTATGLIIAAMTILVHAA